MKAKRLLLAILAAAAPCLAWAQTPGPITIANGNSTLTVSLNSDGNLGGASDPVNLPAALVWNVEGRAIMVYPSSPWDFVDVAHLHADLHVGANQIHAQGPMLGFATGEFSGNITGGAVYTLNGSVAGSGFSRLTEKVDIHNATNQDITLDQIALLGMGFKPVPVDGFNPVPDLTGLHITGTSIVFFQGKTSTYSIADFPAEGGFPPSMVTHLVTFTGFNPLYEANPVLKAGSVLTIITELILAPPGRTICASASQGNCIHEPVLAP
jgi:hypothetical protein